MNVSHGENPKVLSVQQSFKITKDQALLNLMRLESFLTNKELNRMYEAYPSRYGGNIASYGSSSALPTQ